jgi:hypothetical protein
MLSGEYQRMASRVARSVLPSTSVRGLYQIFSPSPRREMGRSMPMIVLLRTTLSAACSR